METITGESEEPQEGRASYTAASQTESWQLDPGERGVWLGRVSSSHSMNLHCLSVQVHLVISWVLSS